MEREEYFLKLHYELAEAYEVDTYYIRLIRTLALGYKLTRGDICLKLIKLSNLSRWKRGVNGNLLHLRRRPKSHYSHLLHFIRDMSDEDWDIITKKTSYDR